MTFASRAVAVLTSVAFLLASCGGGGGGGDAANPPTPPSQTPVFAVLAQEALTSADVQKILAQTIEEAGARSKPAVIAVVDRVGNVLAVFQICLLYTSPSPRD